MLVKSKYKMKWGIDLIKVTKAEAEWLRNNNFADKVKHTYTKHKTYYIVEDYKYKFDANGDIVFAKPVGALKALHEHRKSTIIKTILEK